MTIKTEDLKRAFSSFAAVTKRERTEVDLAKVATMLVQETAAAITSDDPDAVVKNLIKRVDSIDAMLSGAQESPDGAVFVSAAKDDKLVQEFAKMGEAAGGGGGKPSFPAGVATGSGKGTDTVGAGGGGGKAKFPSGVQSGSGKGTDEVGAGGGGGKKKAPKSVANSGTTETKPTTTAKGEDDADDIDPNEEDWASDMAPKNSPVRKSERYTSRERPIKARPGARARTQKYEAARERALATAKPERNLG